MQDAGLVGRSVDLCAARTVHSLKLHQLRLCRDVRSLEQSSLRFLDELLAKYAQMVSQKRSIVSAKFNMDKRECAAKLRQAETVYAMKKFGYHVNLGIASHQLMHGCGGDSCVWAETKGKVRLTQLSTDSAQFVRCDKAVRENARPKNRDSVRVLAVFKADNTLLLSNFQVWLFAHFALSTTSELE